MMNAMDLQPSTGTPAPHHPTARARLAHMPWLWPALDPARHGIAKDEQEALFQRVRASLNPRELDEFARLMDSRYWQGLDVEVPGFGHLYAQCEYTSMADVAWDRLTRAEHRTMTTPWQVVTSRPALLMDRHDFGSLTPHDRGVGRETFPWGTVYVQTRQGRPVMHYVSTRKSTPELNLLALPLTFESGATLPYAPVWSAWMMLWLVLFMAAPAALTIWALPLCAAGAIASSAAIGTRLRHDMHPIKPDTALERLVQYATHDQDTGLLTQLRAAGWTWERLDSWSLVECVELASRGRDGGLVAELVAAGWSLDDDGAPELVEVAGRAVLAADHARVVEARVEVPGLVRSCETVEDMHAACAALSVLCRDLDDLAEVEAAHRAQIEAPVEQARAAEERDLRVAAAERARARAVASLESSRQAVRFTTAAHRALMDEQTAL